MSLFKELPVISGPRTHSPSKQDPIVGIDLGTTNSLVAIVENGVPVVIPTLEGHSLLPSVVHFLKNGEKELGYKAKRQKTLDAEHTVYSVKRLLGRGSNDVNESIEKMLINLDDSSASNLKIKVEDKTFTAIEISAMILKELKAAAEQHLGRPVEDAVITVPAYFNDSQRQATRAAGRLAGFNVLRILNEPTAASLAYGLQHKKNGLIAVYDLGGGTFDVSILKLHDGIFEVLSTNGDTQLGGDDFDHVIANWIKTSFDKKSSQVNWESLETRAALLDVAEKIKIKLSTEPKAVETFEGQSFTLDRPNFEKMILPLLSRTKNPVEAAISDAGLKKVDITDIILVGGPTRLPLVKEFVAELFGKKPNTSMHPDEVVAMGAAIQADILAGNNTDLLLLDVVPLSLGIETFGGAMSKIIPRNTRIPTLAKEQFTTFKDGQTKVAINVFQGERDLVANNRKLSEFVLSGIPPLPASLARVEVTFLVDADGILSVSAKELYSGAEASIEVRPTYGLTDAEVEKMLEDGLKYAEADLLAARLIDAKNDAETLLLASEKSLVQVQRNLTKQESEKIQSLISDLKNKVQGTNLAEIKSAHKALNQGTTHLAEILMSHTLETNFKNKNVNDMLNSNKSSKPLKK